MKTSLAAMMAAVVAISLALLGACSFDSSALQECSSNADCGSGMICSQSFGYCISEIDAGSEVETQELCGESPCFEAQTCCDEQCVDTETDPLNCGACGTACGEDLQCVDGVCECPIGFADCDEDEETGCESDLGIDDENCGACGTPCESGQICLGGICACPVGFATCTEEVCETDILSDPYHCGACNEGCGASESCVETRCSCGGDDPCKQFESCCSVSNDAVCVSIASSPTHCGACGNRCPSGETCQDGECACGASGESCEEGQICCKGQSCTDPALCDCGGSICSDEQTCCNESCVDLDSDPDNCGACGVSGLSGQVCVDGTPVCPSGTGLCGGACVNTLTDPDNCGACGVKVGEERNCVGGVPTCKVTGETWCGNTCVDLRTDPMNCGACNVRVVAEQTCINGVPTCPGNGTLCGAHCTDTKSDPNNCGTCGTKVVNTQTCINGVPTCPSSGTLCGGICKVLQSDPENCGVCGNSVVGEQTCENGIPTCPNDGTLCGQHCRELLSDVQNCGSCGNICPTAENGVISCDLGQCELTCDTGMIDCDGDEVSCEANTTSDPDNCGTCGLVCTGGKPVCNNSVCICSCGDGQCQPEFGEKAGCPSDCPYSPTANDTFCDISGGEAFGAQYPECQASCGDHDCGGTETYATCSDCDSRLSTSCPNGTCEWPKETGDNCPADCGALMPIIGVNCE